MTRVCGLLAAGIESASSSGMKRRFFDRAFAVGDESPCIGFVVAALAAPRRGWAGTGAGMAVAGAAPRRGWAGAARAGASAAAVLGGDAAARSSGFVVASSGDPSMTIILRGAGVVVASSGVPPTARRRLRAAGAGAGGLVRDDRAVAPLRGRDDSWDAASRRASRRSVGSGASEPRVARRPRARRRADGSSSQ